MPPGSSLEGKKFRSNPGLSGIPPGAISDLHALLHAPLPGYPKINPTGVFRLRRENVNFHPSVKLLKIVAYLFSVLSWFLFLVAVFGAAGIVLGNSGNLPKPMAILILLGAGLYFCLFQALSGILGLLLVLEERTRSS